MEKFWEKFDQIAGQIGQYAPVVYDKLLLYIQLKSIGYLILGGLLALISLGFFLAARRIIEKHDGDEDAGPWVAVFVVCGIISIMTGVGATFNLLEMWNWIGAFVPEARLINDLYNAATTTP